MPTKLKMKINEMKDCLKRVSARVDVQFSSGD